MATVRRVGTRDIVLFVADEHWHCFDQLAVALGRRGLRPIRVVASGRRGLVTRLVDRWVYRGVIDLRRPDAAATLERLGSRVLDVQVDERTFASLDRGSTAVRALAELDRTAWDRRAALYDKVALAQRLDARGICIAPVLRADRTTAADATARFGLPIVVKRRTGTGGREVRVVHDAAALPSTVAALGTDADVFYQAHVAGALLGYGAVVHRGVPIQECVAREHKSQCDPLGPTAWTEPRRDDRVLHAGRAVLDAIAVDGFFSVEFLQAPDGSLCFIDASVRAWGSFMSWATVGLDLTAGYLYAIGASEAPCTTTRHDAHPATAVYPTALYDVLRTGSWATAMRDTVRLGRRYVPHVGVRYLAITATALAADRVRQGRRAAPTAPGTVAPVSAATAIP